MASFGKAMSRSISSTGNAEFNLRDTVNILVDTFDQVHEVYQAAAGPIPAARSPSERPLPTALMAIPEKAPAKEERPPLLSPGSAKVRPGSWCEVAKGLKGTPAFKPPPRELGIPIQRRGGSQKERRQDARLQALENELSQAILLVPATK